MSAESETGAAREGPSAPEVPEAPDRRRSFALSRWLFLRLVGVVFVCAFVSLRVQLDGLLGSRGILPATEVAEWLERDGPAWHAFPCLFRGPVSDDALRRACDLGIAAGALLAVGVLPGVMLLGAGALYLAFVLAGRSFFSYQWDALLLETAGVAFLLAPRTLLERPSRAREPSQLALFAARVLLFKLMFLSGFVKLGDAEWDELTALEYHWWTQPLPTFVAWYAALLPTWVQKASVVVMFAIELVAPFLVFGPRHARRIAAGAFAVLMALIGLTGNYNFFNLLTVALCVLCVDDALLGRLVPERFRPREPGGGPPSLAARLAGLPAALAAVALALFSLSVVADRALPERSPVPDPVREVRGRLMPFYLCNAYGLFANMTTVRFEIELEASLDGARFEPYVFRWKPGPLDRRPGLCAPHQPRLDWEMWFAALPDPRTDGASPIPFQSRAILPALCQRLLEGEPAVRALFAEVPFDGETPRYLRATARPYTFTTAAERAETGNWWKAGDPQPFVPEVTLRNGRLAVR